MLKPAPPNDEGPARLAWLLPGVVAALVVLGAFLASPAPTYLNESPWQEATASISGEAKTRVAALSEVRAAPAGSPQCRRSSCRSAPRRAATLRASRLSERDLTRAATLPQAGSLLAVRLLERPGDPPGADPPGAGFFPDSSLAQASLSTQRTVVLRL